MVIATSTMAEKSENAAVTTAPAQTSTSIDSESQTTLFVTSTVINAISTSAASEPTAEPVVTSTVIVDGSTTFVVATTTTIEPQTTTKDAIAETSTVVIDESTTMLFVTSTVSAGKFFLFSIFSNYF
jgi:hypothetical protein